jgi:hypothetical protein
LQIIRDDKNENTRVNIEFGKAKQDKEILIFINIVLALFITLIRKERNILVLVGCSLTIGVHRTTGVQLNIRIQVFVNKRRFLSNFERMKMKIKKKIMNCGSSKKSRGGPCQQKHNFYSTFLFAIEGFRNFFYSLSVKYHLIFKRLRIKFKTLFNSYYFKPIKQKNCNKKIRV